MRLILLALVACGPMQFRFEPPPSVASGCFDGTSGDSGHACFAWRSTSDLSAPVAAGSDTTIDVSSELPFAQVSSTDATIADFWLDGGSIEVHAGRPGSVDLVLQDARGREVDRVLVTVAPTIVLSTFAPRTIAMLAGASDRFHVSTVGPGGVPTVGVGAVSFSAEGTARLASYEILPDGDERTFWGDVGHGRVVARAGTAVTAIDVDFVPESAVTSIDAQVTGPGQVRAVARSAYGPVYGASCDWTTYPAASVAQSASGIEEPAGSDSVFSLGLRGVAYTATCTIGSAHATVQLRN
jgi:hypothetical protein